MPSPAVFNHVITTVELPGGRLWLDSTPEGAPYRQLSAAIRDQSALVVPAEAPAALDRTPAAPPTPCSRTLKLGTLDAEGKLTGNITTVIARMTKSCFMRWRAAYPADWDKVSQYISSLTGFGGTTSDTTITNAEDLSSPIISPTLTLGPLTATGKTAHCSLLPALEFTALGSEHNPSSGYSARRSAHPDCHQPYWAARGLSHRFS